LGGRQREHGGNEILIQISKRKTKIKKDKDKNKVLKSKKEGERDKRNITYC
jgi:hypothetical protein